MAQISVTIAGRAFRMACEDGQEEHLTALAATLDPDQYRVLARATFAEMALAGITLVGEFHYLHHGPGGAPYADPNEMSVAILDAAHAAADKWGKTSPTERSNLLLKIADRLEANLELLAYAETDTLCYRADPDEPLHRAQHATWEPLLTATETREGIAFTRVCGVIHRPQPPATLAHLAARLAAQPPFVLAALTTLASLAASLVVALAALDPTADLAALWAAACLEEEWQADLWGRDPEAEARRAGRAQSFAAAARFAQLAVAEG